MPIAAMSRAVRPAWRIASAATLHCVAQISSGSCSTQPGRGKIWRNSFCAAEIIEPARSNKMARELVVPWSRARIYFIEVPFLIPKSIWVLAAKPIHGLVGFLLPNNEFQVSLEIEAVIERPRLGKWDGV